jgi:Phage terminase, small subunit
VPLSRDPEKRARQLANLRPGAHVAPLGNTRTLKHGARRVILRAELDAEVAEIYRALAEAAPVRDPDGGLPAADEAAVEVAARALKRWREVNAWCNTFGRIEEKTGRVKPAVEAELACERALKAALRDLGLDPTARAKLGLDVARAQSFDLARYWQEHPPADLDGEAEEAEDD